jgi:hypothetical protein
MSKYPQDEFDRIPETAARQGVHRERLVAVRGSGLGLKLAVGVLALLVGLAAYFLLPRIEAGGSAPAEGAASTPQATSSAESGEGQAPSDRMSSPGATEPAASASASAEAEDPDVDRAQVLNVLNSTGVPGLASTAAGRLADAGWTATVPGNWAGTPLEASVVFYNSEAQRPSAEAVGSALGIPAVQQAADVSPAVTVVLGPGFQ